MSPSKFRILILGGYGVFGGRIAQLLANEAALEIIIAGRSVEKAGEFCNKHGKIAIMNPAIMDRNGVGAEQISEMGVNLFIDAAGPFQAYGDDPYRLMRAALEANANYINLADSSAFAASIPQQLDVLAQARGLFALSGVSSFPVLTAAAVREMLALNETPVSIESALAPSPHADMGVNVIRAIASYAGKPVARLQAGKTFLAPGLIETRRFTVAAPGARALGERLFRLVDIPDLLAFQKLWPQLKETWAGVSTPPVWLEKCLAMAARLCAWRILPSLVPFAPLMHRIKGIFAHGAHRGGMSVLITGIHKEGGTFRRRWGMIAEGDSGPFIPAMPAAAIVKRCMAHHPPAPGARMALRELQIADYQPLFDGLGIRHGWVEEAPSKGAPLFQSFMGSRWLQLPAAVRKMHSLPNSAAASGRVNATRGGNILARLAARFAGFAPSMHDAPVRVCFKKAPDGEIWERNFDGHMFQSRLTAGTGKNAGLLIEEFGPARFALNYTVEKDHISLTVERWSFAGLPMPGWLAPQSDSREFEDNGVFHFDVRISHPLCGLIVHYKGWLEPAAH